MSGMPITVQGLLMPDGTLQLDEKVSLPSGRVRVTVQPLPEPLRESLEVVMARVWAAQKARGHVPRGRETIDAEVNALRDAAEEELRAIEYLHEQDNPARESPRE